MNAKKLLNKINKSEIVDKLVDHLTDEDSVVYYDIDNEKLIGMNVNENTKIPRTYIEIARIDKDVDFKYICNDCNDECINYNWRKTRKTPPNSEMIEECIWNDTYDNLWDIYSMDENQIQKRLDNMEIKKQELKIKLAFQWGKFCETREKTELSIDGDYKYIKSIIQTFNENWRILTKKETQALQKLFNYDSETNIYNILNLYDYIYLDSIVMQLHPIFKEIISINKEEMYD